MFPYIIREPNMDAYQLGECTLWQLLRRFCLLEDHSIQCRQSVDRQHCGTQLNNTADYDVVTDLRRITSTRRR